VADVAAVAGYTAEGRARIYQTRTTGLLTREVLRNLPPRLEAPVVVSMDPSNDNLDIHVEGYPVVTFERVLSNAEKAKRAQDDERREDELQRSQANDLASCRSELERYSSACERNLQQDRDYHAQYKARMEARLAAANQEIVNLRERVTRLMADVEARKAWEAQARADHEKLQRQAASGTGSEAAVAELQKENARLRSELARCQSATQQTQPGPAESGGGGKVLLGLAAATKLLGVW
jgi:hypothetical protein